MNGRCNWAERKGRHAALKHALFRAYFGDDQDVSATEVPVQLAGEAGLDGERARQVLASGAYAGERRAGVARRSPRGNDPTLTQPASPTSPTNITSRARAFQDTILRAHPCGLTNAYANKAAPASPNASEAHQAGRLRVSAATAPSAMPTCSSATASAKR